MRVVVVDDERLVQIGIQTYLQQAGERYEIRGVYANGQEAVAALKRENADVLLTDIKMPVMDGLELIRKVRAERLATAIVVLSCHNEFDLVRDAFTSGADEYVLKHEVEQAQLVEVIDRTTRKHQLSSEPHGGPEVREWGWSEARLSPDLPVLCATFRFKHSYDADFNVTPWEPVATALEAEIDRVLALHPPAVYIKRPGGHVLLFGLRSKEEVEPHRRVRQAALELLTAVRRYWNREMQMWILKEPVLLREVPEIEEDIHRLRETAIYTDGDALLILEGVGGVLGERPQAPKIHLGEMDAPESWIDEVNSFLDSARRLSLPPGELRLALSGMLHQVDRDLHELTGSTLSQVLAATAVGKSLYKESLPGKVEQFDDLEVLKAWLTLVLKETAESLTETYRRNTRLSQILDYIDGNYKQSLKLTDLSERFNMSRSYLCTRFKEETNQTFSQYLNRRRIEKAQELLKTSEMTAKEICFEVGYENPNYFSRVFKSFTGVSVSDYRNAQTRTK